MTRAELIKLAMDAGLIVDYRVSVEGIERFAELVAAAERKACARMVRSIDASLAYAIRERGEHERVS